MKTLQAIFLSVFVVGMLAGCTTSTEPSREAKLVTYEELRVTPGFGWLEAEINVYTPDAAAVDAIRAAYSSKQQDVFLFVNPSCSCTGTKKTFPQTLKTLQAAGVPSSKITIYTMSSFRDSHPLSQRFQLKGLPSVFISQNGTTIFSMESKDEVLFYGQPSSGLNPANSKRVETMLSEGFAL